MAKHRKNNPIDPRVYIASAAVAFVVVVAVVILSLVGGGVQTEEEGPQVPDNMVLVNDIYEGERLVPKFDMDLNTYDTEKFVEDGSFITWQRWKS